MFDGYRRVRVLGLHDHIPEMGWSLLAEMDTDEVFAPVSALKRVLSVAAVLLAIGALALAYLLARRISRPIHRLRVGSQRLGAGELDYRLNIKTGDEIEQLAEEFNSMAARLSELYASLEQKVADRTAELTKEIDERKRAEEELRESEERLRTMSDSAQDAIIMMNPEGNISFWNRAAEEILGYSSEEVIGSDLHRLLAPERFRESQLEGFRKFRQTGEGSAVGQTLELAAVRKGGEEFPIELSLSAVRLQDGWHAIGIIRDITERKRAEEELQCSADRLASLNTELGRSNRDLQEFTYTVSHDLQEPLRKIHTFGQFLVEDCGEHIPDEGRQHLRRMQEATVRMKNLIQHLLTLARVGTRGGELVPVESRPVLDAVLDTLSEQVRQSGAEVTVEGEFPTVMADAVQLGQVFQNLISNALKFRSPERVLRVTIRADVEGDQATFSVSDNGIGIEERFLEKIFGVFQRLHPREQYEGAGVGLALCEKIVRRHGGSIRVESTPGEGTTFHVVLSTAPEQKEEDRDVEGD